MVQLAVVEDRPTPKEVYGWRVYTMAMIACFASVAIGYDSAFIGTSISSAPFKADFGITGLGKTDFANLSGNIVSTYQLGAFAGGLLSYPIGHFLGRKNGLRLAAVLFVASSAIQLIPHLIAMYIGRVFLGVAVGCGSSLTPSYIAEISPAAIRGRLIALFEAGWQVGAVVGFWINYGINQNKAITGSTVWRIPFGVQIIPGGLLLIGTFTPVFTESPRWLASRDRPAEAVKALAYIRNLPEDHEYVQMEMEDISVLLEANRSVAGSGFAGPIKTLFGSRSLLKRLAICVGLFACQNGTGINAINYYSPTIFASIGVTGTSTSLLSTGIFGLIKFAGAIVWLLWLVDRYGRRSLLMVGAAGGCLAMLWIAIYIAVAKPTLHPTAELSGGGIAAMVAIYLWTCFYSPSWNGTPWVYGSEVFPQAVRSASTALIASSNWLFAFAVARGTPVAFLNMGVGGWGYFLFFAACMIISIIFVYFIVPESKQVPLERVNELFEHPARRAWGIVMSKKREEVMGPQASHFDSVNGSMNEGKPEQDFKERV